MDFSLVIACYFEEPHLFQNVLALKDYLATTTLKWEMIFVEDGSRDRTADEVRRCVTYLTEHGWNATAHFHTQNQGRGASVQEGFLAARGDVVGYIDIDLEHPMDAILPMFLAIKSGVSDGVVANRIWEKRRINPVRTVASLVYRILTHSLLDLKVQDSEAGLKLFRRDKLLPVLQNCSDKAWFWDTEICDQCDKHGLILKDHPIVFVKNPKKVSTVRVFRDSIIYFLRLVAYSRAQSLRKAPSEDSAPSISIH